MRTRQRRRLRRGALRRGTAAGLDFSQKAIDFARGHHRDPRLRFVCGDAEALPFADASFDAVLNVESSHCYPNVPRFTPRWRACCARADISYSRTCA